MRLADRGSIRGHKREDIHHWYLADVWPEPHNFQKGPKGANGDGKASLNLDSDRGSNLHDEIARIEDRIEQLTGKIESCRKLILASRIIVAGGACVFTGMLFGAIRFDPGAMAAAIAALLGGIAVLGSNRSTAQEATNELTTSAADRSMLIQKMDLRDVTPARALSGSQNDTIA
jgi:hypothetical protein